MKPVTSLLTGTAPVWCMKGIWDLQNIECPFETHIDLSQSAKTISFGMWLEKWRSGPESNRRIRICNPPHNHSATGPRSGHIPLAVEMRGISGRRGRVKRRRAASMIVFVFRSIYNRKAVRVWRPKVAYSLEFLRYGFRRRS